MPKTSFDSTELPALQPHSHCVLIPRDPHFVYAYWDYTKKDIDSARHKLYNKSEDPKLVLRVHDITAKNTWDIDVGSSVKNSYVHVSQGNADYYAELGVRLGAKHFIPLTRSNVVRTPPDTTSKRDDLIWQEIEARKESKPYIEEEIGQSAAAEFSKKIEVLRGAQDRQQIQTGLMPAKRQKRSSLPQAKGPQGRRIYYLTAKDIRDYYMKLFAGVSKKGKRKVQTIEDALKGKWRGVPWAKVRPIMTSPDLLKGASENLFSFQARSSAGRLNQRKFFFEIWSEVIVHGHTEPDAALWLNQKGIQLNPDGTFSLRYILPDGEIPLEFIAQSSDAVEERRITTRIQRDKTMSFTKIKEGPIG